MDGNTRAPTRGEGVGGRVLKCPFFPKKIVEVGKMQGPIFIIKAK